MGIADIVPPIDAIPLTVTAETRAVATEDAMAVIAGAITEALTEVIGAGIVAGTNQPLA